MKQQSKIWIILVSLWIINGSSFLAIKVAIDTIPPLLSAGIRFIISGAVMFAAYYFLQKKGHHPPEHIGKRQWRDTLILGITLFLGGQGLLAWGAQYLSSGITGLLNSTIPLWVAILALLIFRKRLTKLMIMGLGLGFGGLMLLVAPSLGNGSLSLIGTVALIISSVSWALGSLYSSKAHLPVSILASSGMLMLVGGIIITIVSTALGESHNLQLSQISARSLAALIFLITINSMVAFTDFYWLLRVTTPSLANTFAYVSPVIAVILGWAILKEPLASLTVVAMGVILAGVALMVTTSSKIKDKKPSSQQQKANI